MRKRRPSILFRRVVPLLLAAAAVAVSARPADLRAAGKQPKKTDGGYEVTVGGYYVGRGTADVQGGGKKVHIKATVRTEDGREGNLNAPNLKLDGDHFEGRGKVSGVDIQIVGRLDGYADDKDFRRARLLCTYRDDDGNVGRIVGVLR